MLPSTRTDARYTAVEQSDTASQESGQDIEKADPYTDGEYEVTLDQPRSSRKKLFVCLFLCTAVVSFLAGFFSVGRISLATKANQHGQLTQDTKASACREPVLRREWRSLSHDDKKAYLKAAKCLTEIPSKLGLNQSHHHDFAWVHKRIGETSHDAAMFVAWHRYFIHTYETALRTSCGFEGHLSYWDWTLDWEDITKAPVWDSETGFGGDGNRQHAQDILNAHCVTDGPFANLEIPYIEHIYYPHCLARGFETRYNLTVQGEFLRPEYIEKLLSNDDYEQFNLGMEHGPHIAIPKSVNGDFSLHTAPYDPVFFLHHTQLDRTWWRWQQRDPERRQYQYKGASTTDSKVDATIHDMLDFGELMPPIEVSQVLRTDTDLLCYRY